MINNSKQQTSVSRQTGQKRRSPTSSFISFIDMLDLDYFRSKISQMHSAKGTSKHPAHIKNADLFKRVLRAICC